MQRAEVLPAMRAAATLAGIFLRDPDARQTHRFLTRRAEAEMFGFEGVAGDSHGGWTRKADARTPWYARGTPIRNVRQVTIVSTEELAEMAAALGVAEVRPEWLGATLALEGLPALSYLPRGTRLETTSGAVFACEGYNFPCLQIGRAVADVAGLADPKAVVKAAARRRGILATVERPGPARAGDAVEAHVPEQWLWRSE